MAAKRLSLRLVRTDTPPWWMTPLIPVMALIATFFLTSGLILWGKANPFQAYYYLLIEPLTMARYVDELGSPWVKSYFDVGNVMRWGYRQHWIEVLGKRIDKIHIKEFSLKVAMREGMIKAFDFPIGQGDINWKRVREELKKIEFQGWATVEVPGGDRQKLADISAQLDRVLYA